MRWVGRLRHLKTPSARLGHGADVRTLQGHRSTRSSSVPIDPEPKVWSRYLTCKKTPQNCGIFTFCGIFAANHGLSFV